MTEHIEVLRQMRQSLLDFVDDLMVIIPEEKNLLWFRIFIESQVPIMDVMTYIVKNIVPLEARVKARDEQYFRKNAVLFEKLGNFKSEVNRFEVLWDKNDKEEDREIVWNWMEHFIDLGKNYCRLAPQD